MYCRKIVIISGQERIYENVKGILTMSTETNGVCVKISVYHLPAVETRYKVVIACGRRTLTRAFTAKGLADEVFMENVSLSPTDKIHVLVGLEETGKPVAYGSNAGVSMWDSGLVAKMVREEPARATVATIVAKPVTVRHAEPAQEKEPIGEEARVRPKEEEESVSLSGTLTEPPAEDAVRVCVERREETCETIEEAQEKLARRRAAEDARIRTEETRKPIERKYDDDRLADYNYYPGCFGTNGRRIRIADAEAAAEAELGAWGGYNTIYRPRLERKPTERKTEERPAAPSSPKYYLSVKGALDALFRTAAAEEPLNRALSGTRWVKVPYRSGQYYCVGLIGTAPDYIGYAVPGTYDLNPPRQLEGLSKWLPASAERPRGEGYWVMFQDAVTGASVRLD